MTAEMSYTLNFPGTIPPRAGGGRTAPAGAAPARDRAPAPVVPRTFLRRQIRKLKYKVEDRARIGGKTTRHSVVRVSPGYRVPRREPLTRLPGRARCACALCARSLAYTPSCPTFLLHPACGAIAGAASSAKLARAAQPCDGLGLCSGGRCTHPPLMHEDPS